VRFPNEIQAIHNSGGIVVRVKRGADPEWFDSAVSFNYGPDGNSTWSLSKMHLEQMKIHASEYSWVGGNIDYTVYNDTTIDELFEQIESLVKSQELDLPVSMAA
jgi:hypothetical protein